MSSEPAITLYDISSTVTPQAWSPNTWKARAVLNYKGIPYRTEWISYPDIQSTLKKLGGEPTSTSPEGNPHYTLPAIVDDSGDTPTVITDSLAIAEYLDAKYPDRLVFPKQGKALEYAFEEACRSIVGQQLRAVMLPLAWKILDPRSQVYYRETREKWYGNGKPLEEWSPEGPTRERQWEEVKGGFDRLSKLLDKNGPDAKYVAGGSEPTRADMIIVSSLAWIISCAPDDWNNRVKHWNGGRWERLWKVSEPWRAVH